MSYQKYAYGDLVQVAKDLGHSMSHFTADCRAIVIGSYKDQFGGGEREKHIYTIYLEGRGECSWYDEHQLELIERDQGALLESWRAERKAKDAQESDLNWIFSRGIPNSFSGASIEALGKQLGFDNLWGAHGEGITYYANSLAIMAVAEPFLKAHDKEGFLEFAASLRISHS